MPSKQAGSRQVLSIPEATPGLLDGDRGEDRRRQGVNSAEPSAATRRPWTTLR
jgi:hypothetical protein